jgi:aspartate/methionine/tyrosine aminotransferase
MYSHRLRWDAAPNPLAQALARRRAAGLPILDLTESNPTRAGFRYPAGLLAPLADPSALVYDPHPAGLPAAREAVAAAYAARGVPVEPSRVLLTASTSDAYAWCFKLLCDPGDEVLIPRPSYPLFEFLAGLESVRAVPYPLFYDYGWHVDTAALAAAIGPRTRAIVLVNPNNPTGSFVKRHECGRLLDLASAHSLALLSDEVFADYAFAPDPDRVATLASLPGPPVFVLSGLSKIAGLPQLKLGWIVANSLEALARLEWIADTYLPVGTPVQCALPRLLALGDEIRRQIRERTRANLAQLCGAFAPLAVEGGWYAILPAPRTRSEQEWTLALLDQGVLVQPGFFYDFPSEAYLVLSLLTPPGVFAAGLDVIRRTVAP